MHEVVEQPPAGQQGGKGGRVERAELQPECGLRVPGTDTDRSIDAEPAMRAGREARAGQTGPF